MSAHLPVAHAKFVKEDAALEAVIAERLLAAYAQAHPDISRQHRALIAYMVREYLRTRSQRYADLESPTVQTALTHIQQLLGDLSLEDIVFRMCVDGRVLTFLGCGIPKGSQRMPAARFPDVVTDEKGAPYLLENGTTALFLRAHFEHHDTLVLVLDSHQDCGARKAELTGLCGGVLPLDEGLGRDVEEKTAAVAAIQRHIAIHFPGKYFFALLYTFDPHTGTLSMGRDQTRDHAPLITTDDVKALQAFLPLHAALLDLPIDFAHAYADSVMQLWETIATHGDAFVKAVRVRVAQIFPNETPEQHAARTLMLVGNAAIHTVLCGANGAYPVHAHEECVISLGKEEHGYFLESMHAFTMLPDGGTDFVLFMITLIRKARRAWSLAPRDRTVCTDIFGDDTDALVSAPVCVFCTEAIAGDISDQEWRTAVDTDFGFLATENWFDCDDAAFKRMLLRHEPDLAAEICTALISLRKTAQRLADPQSHVNSLYRAGEMVLVGIVRNGCALLPVVFCLRGYAPAKNR